jgi:hypothetical protein
MCSTEVLLKPVYLKNRAERGKSTHRLASGASLRLMLREWDQLEIEEVWIEREDKLITKGVKGSNEERLVRIEEDSL